MEEVDNIIIHFLRQLNINIEDEIKQLSDLPVNIIIGAVSKCLAKINPGLKVPQEIPQGISQRIEIATQLAAMCKDLGYKNEVGYQTFLYYNEADLRKIFMFLIENLPSEDKQGRAVIEPTDKRSILKRNISRTIHRYLNQIWIPHYCPSEENQTDHAQILSEESSSSNITMNSKKLLKMMLQTKEKRMLINSNSQINDNAEILCDMNQKAKMKEINLHPSKTLKELKEEVILLRLKLNTLENEKIASNAEFAKINKSCEIAESELNSVKTILSRMNVNIDEDTDDVLEKNKKQIYLLHNQSETLTSKILSLKTEIQKIKSYLPQSQRSDCRKKLTILKETAKSLKDEYNNKEESKESLKQEYAKLNRGNKRSIYTKRILEIISNVDKQNLEIKKILEDTRELQKEINSLEGQLDRCFSVADETLFNDAKKDDQAKKAYKLLALLHSECNTIVKLVTDTGVLSREIVDLEDHVNTEKSKQIEEILKKIQSDLSQMQEES